MSMRIQSKLNPKKKYLQVALNSTLEEAREIISNLPVSDRIIIEAGTPLIKRYGEHGIRQIRDWYESHVAGRTLRPVVTEDMSEDSVFFQLDLTRMMTIQRTKISPYVIADLKTIDRGETEVEIAARGGASAAIAMGNAPIETLNNFISTCEKNGMDAMVDMMNVEFPLSVLRALKKIPPIIILHRGVDEERDNREKQIPLHEIRRIKGSYDIMISIAGGDTLREVQRSIFNDANIVVVWKAVYHKTKETVELINGFLREIK